MNQQEIIKFGNSLNLLFLIGGILGAGLSSVIIFSFMRTYLLGFYIFSAMLAALFLVSCLNWTLLLYINGLAKKVNKGGIEKGGFIRKK
jgi:hypothetical protein